MLSFIFPLKFKLCQGYELYVPVGNQHNMGHSVLQIEDPQ